MGNQEMEYVGRIQLPARAAGATSRYEDLRGPYRHRIESAGSCQLYALSIGGVTEDQGFGYVDGRCGCGDSCGDI